MFMDKTTHFKMPERVPPWDGEREGKGKISTPKKDILNQNTRDFNKESASNKGTKNLKKIYSK